MEKDNSMNQQENDKAEVMLQMIKVEYGAMREEIDYSRAAEPPVRCGESHLSGLTEPPSLSIF